MAFFKSCAEALLQLLSFNSVSPFGPWSQQPLSGLPIDIVSPIDGVSVHSHGASTSFTCEYPTLKGWKSCNTADDRSCWLKDATSKQPLFSQYDITTDYESQWPPGIKREYWLEVTNDTISPDGYLKPAGKVFNHTFPGPLIEACWGDDITVHVTNRLETNGTTIHWHGIRQLHTNEADGVNGVTQCPIATDQTYTYNFKATQYGHTWYHSHYSLQYPDGLAGPLLIHGPNSANWDEALDPKMISDWSHESAFSDFQMVLGFAPPGPAAREPPMQSVLFDGIGNFSCSSSDPRCVPAEQRKPLFSKVFKAGKRYLLRLINSSTESDFVFSIDNHQFQVISNDLVAIKPFTTDSIHIGIGQRYSVIVEANPSTPKQPDGNYWIRTQLSTGCGNINDGNYDPRTGIIRYDPQSTTLPTSTNQTEIDLTCKDMCTESLVPVVSWRVDHQAVNDVLKDTFIADLNTIPTHGYLRWDLTDNPLWLNFSNPTILNLGDPSALPAEYAIVPENYTNGYVYLVITSQQLANFPIKNIVPAAHPIHLHGHDFVILAQSSAKYSVTDSPSTFNYANPPRRDVALLPIGGYLAIAFKPDNPGVWLVHCHIAWHASSGLALQILERQDDIISTLPPGALDATESTCKGWDDWLALPQNDGTFAGDLQDDSGI